MKKRILVTLLLFMLFVWSERIVIYAAEEESGLWFMESIDANEAWKELGEIVAAKPIVVAVIDTGVDRNHPFIKNNLWINEDEMNGKTDVDDDGNGYVDDIYGYDFWNEDGDPMDDSTSDIEGHGTHIAGTVLRTVDATENTNPFQVKVMCLKAGGATGNFNLGIAAEAIRYAVENGATVINMSFGSTKKTKELTETIEWAKDFAIMVAAAGNTASGGAPTTESGYSEKKDFFPAGEPSVVGVMAYDVNNLLAGFSNWDYQAYTDVDYEVAAPGTDIYSSVLQEKYKNMSGTSMACAVVSGSAALLCRKYMNEEGDLIKSIPSLTGHLMRNQSDVVKTTDLYGQVHEFPRLNLLSLLRNSLKPEVRVQDVQLENGKITFSLRNWQADAKDIDVALQTTISEKNVETESGDGSITIDSLRALNTLEAQEIDLGLPSIEELTGTLKCVFSLSYGNASDEKDATVYKGAFSFAIENGDEGASVEPLEIPLVSLNVSSALVVMKTEETRVVSVSPLPINATNIGTLKWSTTDPEVVSVTGQGRDAVLSAKKSGKVTIEVSSASGIQSSFQVIVTELPATITPEPSQSPESSDIPAVQVITENIATPTPSNTENTVATTVVLKKPTIKSTKVRKVAKKKKYKVTLKWKKNANASGWRVYRRIKGGMWRLTKRISSAKVTKYVDSGVKKNRVYDYKIKAVGKGSVKDSKMSRIKRVRIP